MKRRTLLMRGNRGALAVAALAIAGLSVTVERAHAAYTARLKAGTLRIDGNAAGDQLALRLKAGSPNTLQVDVGADGAADFSFNRNAFSGIEVDAGRGDDVVQVDQSGGAFTDEQVTMNGGDGNDVLLGGGGEETLLGGRGDDFVDGGGGTDRVPLGDGNDTFQWTPGDGSDTVDGQTGDDRIDVVGSAASETVDVSANGDRVRFARDIAAVVLDLDNTEGIDFAASGGADAVTVHDLAGTDVDTVDIDLAASGGGGDGNIDSVLVEGSAGADNATIGGADGGPLFGGLATQTRVTNAEAQDVLTLATGGGADTVDGAVGIPGPAAIDVLGGDGSDTLRFNGTPAADTMDVYANGQEASIVEASTARLDAIRVEDLVLLGHADADSIGAVGNLATLTTLTLDGGDGNDLLRGANGADLLLGGNGEDEVDGQQGSDTAELGGGNDRFQWDPGDGSDTLDGGEGSDTFDVHGSNIGESIGVSPDGGRIRFTRDIAGITASLDGVEKIDYYAFGGADSIVVDDLAGTDAETVDIDLAASVGGGDGQIDTVVAAGGDGSDEARVSASQGQPMLGLAADTRIAGGEAQDVIRLATGNGDDTIDAVAGIPGPTAVDVDGGNGADTMRFEGTPGDDTIDVFADGTEVTTVGPSTTLLEGSLVENLVLLGHAGADTITATGNLAPLTTLTFDGGDGADDLRGGNGPDLLLGGDGNDVVDGNQGADQALLGAGDDRFEWDPGDGSDVVDGQGDSDLLDFFGSNASETIALSAEGTAVRLTRDVAAISLSLNGLEQVAIHALGAPDTITVNDLTGTPTTTVDVGLGAFDASGDGQPDTVTADGTDAADVVTADRAGVGVVVEGLAALLRIAGSEASNDTLRLQTLGGDDEVAVAPAVYDVIIPVVDLGADD